MSLLVLTSNMSANTTNKHKILVILGPTATGKSDLAVRLAKRFNGEIISADSRQVYKGLDIGTGKIIAREKHGIKHYLLDVASPNKRFSVAQFVDLANDALRNIAERGKVPIMCGGTGFYIHALADGIKLPDVPPNHKLRERLDKLTCAQLLIRLKALDLNRFNTIDKHNKRRIIRAIEIATRLGNVPPVISHSETKGRLDPIFVGLNTSSENLRSRIVSRLNRRLRAGMIDEAKQLHNKGLSWKRMEELGLEYRYLALYLQGKLSLEAMKQQLATAIWHYAKRQMTWFKRDKRIQWFDPTRSTSINRVQSYVAKSLRS
jgi:tRNA dimethylallyltransferase